MQTETENETETETESPAPAPEVKIETPKTVVRALKDAANKELAAKSSYRKLAEVVYDFGKTSTLTDTEVRKALAQAIAEQKGLKIEEVMSSEKNGGNATAYSLLSTLYGLARPKDSAKATAQEKKEAIEEQIANPESQWQEIVQAARGPRKAQEGRTTAGAAKSKAKSPLTADDLAQAMDTKVCLAVTESRVSEISAQDVYNIIVNTVIAAAKKYIASEYPDAVINPALKIKL